MREYRAGFPSISTADAEGRGCPVHRRKLNRISGLQLEYQQHSSQPKMSWKHCLTTTGRQNPCTPPPPHTHQFLYLCYR